MQIEETVKFEQPEYYILIHSMYEKLKKINNTSTINFLELIEATDDDEERKFFITLFNFFLQKKQADLIEKKVF